MFSENSKFICESCEKSIYVTCFTVTFHTLTVVSHVGAVVLYEMSAGF